MTDYCVYEDILQSAGKINWQPASTAPKDTSYFAVITMLGDLEGWTYDGERREWRVRSVPDFVERIQRTTSTIRAWCRWNEVIDHVRETVPLPPGFLRAQ